MSNVTKPFSLYSSNSVTLFNPGMKPVKVDNVGKIYNRHSVLNMKENKYNDIVFLNSCWVSKKVTLVRSAAYDGYFILNTIVCI